MPYNARSPRNRSNQCSTLRPVLIVLSDVAPVHELDSAAADSDQHRQRSPGNCGAGVPDQQRVPWWVLSCVPCMLKGGFTLVPAMLSRHCQC